MKDVRAKHNESFVDIVTNVAGTLEVLFESALANNESVDHLPAPGTKVLVAQPKGNYKNVVFPGFPVAKRKEYVKALKHQNFQDLTLQTKGSFEQLFELALINGVSVTETPMPGVQYRVHDQKAENNVIAYYLDNKIKVATGATIIYEGLFEYGLFEPGLFE